DLIPRWTRLFTSLWIAWLNYNTGFWYGVESYESENTFDRRWRAGCDRVSARVCPPVSEGHRPRQPTRCGTAAVQLASREIANGRSQSALRVRLLGNQPQELRSGEPILDEILRP